MGEIIYPIRINRYLALNNYCSRREADRLIAQSQVRINGRVAKLGDKVNEGDKVEVGPEFKKRGQQLVYFAYNKSVGVVTHSSEQGQEEISDVIDIKLPSGEKVYPLGRLDRDSRGLIILTNDGRITDKLLNPVYEHEKEYAVKVNKPIKKNFLKHLAAGIKLDNYQTKPAKVKQTGERIFHITLIEGKKHQIRRMCDAFGYGVLNLERVRIMNVGLGKLKPGQYRQLEGREPEDFLKSLGL